MPKANAPLASSDVSSDVAGVGDKGQRGLPEEGVHHHQRLPDALISRSCTYIKQLPRNRISETLENVDATLDASFCQVKQAVKVSDLSALACQGANFSEMIC